MPELLANNPKLQKFLADERAAMLAVPIDDTGTVHAASLLYWHSTNPLVFYFVTSQKTEKCKLLKQKHTLQAACVVGTYLTTPFTLQMRGHITILDRANHQSALEHYYAKRGNHHDDINDPENVLLAFTPDWARYTDYAQGYEHHFLDLHKGKTAHV